MTDVEGLTRAIFMADTSAWARENPFRPGTYPHITWSNARQRQLNKLDGQARDKGTKDIDQHPTQEERRPSPVSSAPSMTSEVSDIEDNEYFHQDQLESIDASNGLVLGRFERAAQRASPAASSLGDESSSDEELDDELGDEGGLFDPGFEFGDEDELFNAGFEDGAAEAVLWNLLRKKRASQGDEASEDGSDDSDQIKSMEVPHSDDSSVTLDHEPCHRPGKTISDIALSVTVSQAREEARKRAGDAARKLSPQYPFRENSPHERLDEAICKLSGKPASLSCNNRYVQVKQTDAEASEESSSQDSEVAEEDDFTPLDLKLDMNGKAEPTEDEESDAEPGEDDGSQVSKASEEEDSTPSESDMGEQAEQTEDEDSDAEPGEKDSSPDSRAAEEPLEDHLFGELTFPEYIEPEDGDDEQTGEDGSQVSEAAVEDGSQVSEAAEEDGSQASDAAEEDDPAPNDSSQSVSDEQSDDGDSDVVPLRSCTKRKRVEDIEDIELELKKSKLKREYRLKQIAIKHRYDVKDMELRHELSLRGGE